MNIKVQKDALQNTVPGPVVQLSRLSSCSGKHKSQSSVSGTTCHTSPALGHTELEMESGHGGAHLLSQQKGGRNQDYYKLGLHSETLHKYTHSHTHTHTHTLKNVNIL